MDPSDLRRKVFKVLGEVIVRRVLRECDTSTHPLNALAPESNFEEHAILICIYKDIKNLSYEELYGKVKLWHRIAKSTLEENTKKVRRCLREWAEIILVPDSFAALEKAARRHKRPAPCIGVNLWIDSSDFAETETTGLSRKDSRFSHKTMSEARRWLTIYDGKGRTQFVGGPHHPKHYDADLLIHYAHEVDENFTGSKAVADFAFRKAAPFLKEVALITPSSEAGRPAKDPVTGKKQKRELSEEEQLENKNIRTVRATVEHPYGWLSTKFLALKEKFRDGEDQHDCLIRFALACHRLSKA
jgi:DDE superfamily endonuclease